MIAKAVDFIEKAVFVLIIPVGVLLALRAFVALFEGQHGLIGILFFLVGGILMAVRGVQGLNAKAQIKAV